MQYYRYKNENSIVCLLCKHYCVLKKNKHGICGINYNEESKLLNKTYAHPSVIHIDPVEKKPLYHFLPGSQSLSIGTVGCNFRCPFCQNYSISQTAVVDTRERYSPQRIVDLALQHGVQSISYTYNEPTIWYPYAKDIGILAKEHGMKSIFVSSGYESQEVYADMQAWVDAINVDLKSFSHEYYKRVLKTDLDGVLDSLEAFSKSDIWLEITTLLIPGINDTQEEIEKMAEFISGKLGRDIPWHLSAFHPDYKMQDTPPTSLERLLQAKSIAKNYGIKYVYIGNIANDTSTYCPHCSKKIVERAGYTIEDIALVNGACKYCGEKIQGVWQ